MPENATPKNTGVKNTSGKNTTGRNTPGKRRPLAVCAAVAVAAAPRHRLVHRDPARAPYPVVTEEGDSGSSSTTPPPSS